MCFSDRAIYRLLLLGPIFLGLLGGMACLDEAPSPGESKEPITLEVELNASERELEFFKSLAGEYCKQHPEVKIEWSTEAFEKLKPKLLARDLSARGPDIVFIVNDWIGELVEGEIIESLSPPG